MASIEELKQDIEKYNLNIEDNKEKVEKLRRKAVEIANVILGLENQSHHDLDCFFKKRLNDDQKKFTALMDQYPPFFQPDWHEKKWNSYEHNNLGIVDFLTLGKFTERAIEGVNNYSVPAFSPFIGSKKSLLLECNNNDAEYMLLVLQAIVERVALQLPYAVSFTLLDPERLGHSFPMNKLLPFVRTGEHDTAKTLKNILDEISRIHQDYLDNKADSFEKLPDQIRSNERFEFIFAANFPKDYDRRSIEYLQKISKTGPTAGKYLILHYNSSHKMPVEMSIDGFENIYQLSAKTLRGKVPENYVFEWDQPPPQSMENFIFNSLAKAKPTEHNLQFDEVTSPTVSKWWKEAADSEIRVPIGGSGSSGFIELWFGKANDNKDCSHGMMGAMPGSGKSNLYHVFILGLACRYTPDDVNLYLIDGKQGVEFKLYENLPHVKVISLNTNPPLARSVLEELATEMERRNEMFQDLNVVNLHGYRKLNQPQGNLPRILLIIDEYQTLFDEDKEAQGSQFMLSLASQGRSVGIHIFMGSQRFGVANMLNQTAIFGNMHLRVAMKMADADITALTEFGRKGKRLIRSCDIAGKVVLNDAAGDDDSNKLGKIAWLENEHRSVLVEKIRIEFQAKFPKYKMSRSIVFNGREQPLLSLNRQLNSLFDNNSSRLTDHKWQEFAQSPIHLAGLGEVDWYAGESPSVFWLGQEQNIYGQARVIFRARTQENILIAGEPNEARYGMLGLIAAQIPINHEAHQFKLFIIDRSVKGSPWNAVLNKVQQDLHEIANGNIIFTSEAEEAIVIFKKIISEINRRLMIDEDLLIKEPRIYLLFNEPQRLSALQMQSSKYGQKIHSEVGALLSKILTKGPELGVHSILSLPSVKEFQRLMPKEDQDLFKHRIGLQMTEDESFNFIRSKAASTLQSHGKMPIFSVYLNQSQHHPLIFTPYHYSEKNAELYNKQLIWIKEQLQMWQTSTGETR